MVKDNNKKQIKDIEIGVLSVEASALAKQFDDATLARDVTKLKALIQNVENDIEGRDIFYRLQMYYSLATAVSEIEKLEPTDYDNYLCSLQKQLFYYRKAIKLLGDNSFFDVKLSSKIIPLKASIYTNYGNTLNVCGREIAAIEQFNKALKIHSNYAMAIGNMGMAYMNYADLLSNDNGYERDCFNHYACKMLTAAIESNDPNIYDEAKIYFIYNLEKFDKDYLLYLKKDIVFPQKHHFSKKEKEYRGWCIRNGLFLTPLNDLPIQKLDFAFDTLLLPPILMGVSNDFPIIICMFNQLKQEYISSRYMFYEALNYKSRIHFSDKYTSIAETLEYAQFSLRVEKLKSSFKTLFGILDKIAFFLNEYYELGIRAADVNFKTIWDDEKRGKNGYKYKNKLNIKNNFALKSLYWIQREFEKSEDKYASPQYVRLKEVRNSLEHRYTIITMFTKDVNEIKKDNVAMYISENELYDLTYELLKIVREALICLSLCVSIKEDEKMAKCDYKQIIKMNIHQIDDEFKF